MTGAAAELFIVRVGYLGVDIFFFLSAYTLSCKQIAYLSFLKNRIVSVYGKFLFFLIVAALIKKWSLTVFLKNALFIMLFSKGGGAFLWFLPAIMLFYILFPLFLTWNWKYKVPMVLVLWLFVGILVEKAIGCSQVFIFYNRIPVIMIGYLLQKHDLKKWVCTILLVVGIIIIYLAGFQAKLNVPFSDFYFVLGIPVVVGLAGLSSNIGNSKLVKFLASVTLEVYAVQMLWGPKLVNLFYKQIGNSLTTNILTISAVFVISIALCHSGRLVIRIKSILHPNKGK